MRLAATATSLSRKSVKHLFVIYIALIFFSGYLPAQERNYNFQKIPLSEAILQVSKDMCIKVAFDAQKLSELSIDKEIEGEAANEILDKLLAGSGYEYQLKHGNYLIFKSENTNEKPSECSLIGSISDLETGEQLPYATIKIPEKFNSFPATSHGTFYISTEENNSIRLNISYIGYYSVDTIISCRSAIMNLQFKMLKEFQKIDKVVVKEPKIEMIDFRKDVEFATTINPSKLIDLPMLAEIDVFKALQILPGISYSENSSELSIRGGTGDQNLILFDGQTLYNLSHYYGVFSSINPNVIKDIQVYKGGYDSRYGERVSGIVDITGKTGNQLKPVVYGDVNMVSANLTAEIPVSEKLTIVAAGRRSYADIYATEFANDLISQNKRLPGFAPDASLSISSPTYYFYDYNGKLTYKRSTQEEFSIGFYGAKDRYYNSFSSQNRTMFSNTKDLNIWTNYGVNAYWQKQWNNSLFTKIQAGASGYDSKTQNVTMLEDTAKNNPYLPKNLNNFYTFNRNKLNDFSFSWKNIYNLNDNNQLNFGLLSRFNKIFYHKDAEDKYVYDNTNQNSLLTTLYVQDKITLFPKLLVKPGLRYNYYNGTKKFYLEPRFAASYGFNKKFSIRFATGRFYQFISQAESWQETGYNKDFWVLSDNGSHPVLQSDHFILGTNLNLSNFTFDVETYLKNFSGVQEYIFISPYRRNVDFQKYFDGKTKLQQMVQDTAKPQPSYFISGNGFSYGADFSIRYKKDIFTSWLSYSISRTRVRFAEVNDNKYFPATTDQKHQISFSNMIALGKWNFGLTNIFSTGKPYIAYSTDNSTIPVYREIKRLPDYYRTDVSANYNFRIKRASLKVGATVVNLFNTKNYYDLNSRKFDFENVSFTETNVIKAQGLSLNFFVHFSF